MSGQDLNIALRVQAQLDEARQAVRALKGDVEDLGSAGKKASTDVSGVSVPAAATTTQAPAHATSAANDNATGIKQATAATQDQAAAIAALTANQGRLAEATDRAAVAVERLLQIQGQQSQQTQQNDESQKRKTKSTEDGAQATDRERLAIDRLIGSLDPAAGQAQRLTAAQNELNTALSKGLITQDQHTRLMGLAQKQLGGMGVSAGQTAAAMRMLPAQITDITTSIASGMPIWLVALQQGGQIKDSFGGIGPAFNAITAAINPATAVIGGLALGVGALAAIYLKAEREAFAFNVAIQTTGNTAGATRGRIEALAESANKVSGISKQAAETAAVAMVQSGRLGIETIGNLTTSINGYAAATGQSTDAAAASLAKLFVDPKRAAKELDDQFNFLSVAQRKYISDLMEQGQTEQAQLELSRLTADHFGRVVPENLDILQRAANNVTSAVGRMWNALLNVGKQQPLEQQIKDQEATLNALETQITRRGNLALGNLPQMRDAAKAKLNELRTDLSKEEKKADEQAADQSKKRRAKAVRDEYDAASKAVQTEEQKLADNKKKWERWRNDGDITGDEFNKLVKDADEKAKKKGPKAAKANTPEQEAIQQIRTNLKTLQASIKSSDTFLVNQLEEGRVSIQDAYTKRLAGINQDIDAQRDALEQELNAKGTTKTRQVEIRAALKLLDQSKDDATRELDKWKRAEELKLANIVVRLRIDTAAITGEFDKDAIRKQLELQYAEDLRAAGRSNDPQEAKASRERVQLLIDAGAAQAEFNNKLAEAQRLQNQLSVIEQEVQNRASQGQISQVEAEARIKQARSAQVPMLEAIVAELERVRNGLPPEAAVAVDNMSTSIGTLKNQVANATPAVVDLGTRLKNTMIDGVADAAANAVTNFKSLGEMASATLRQIAGDIVRSDIKRLLTSMFTPDTSGGSTVIGTVIGSVGKMLGFAEGGRIVGPGTGTSDSIPALVNGVRPIAVSNGEFIHPEKAVRHYGVGFMEAVRTLRLPKPQFAFGGLVNYSQRARFATGGSVGSASAADAAALPIIDIRVANSGTPKQQVGQPTISRESGRLIIDVVIADLIAGGRVLPVVKAGLARD